MRISDWSSDVCSSDLLSTSSATRVRFNSFPAGRHASHFRLGASTGHTTTHATCSRKPSEPFATLSPKDRKSVVWGKRVSVRVDLGGRRIIKKKQLQKSEERHN